jgi:DNA-nicking Smr family endonuclease
MAGIHQKTQSTSSTLDLHYLNLVEASCLLDTFLDTQIERLRNVRKPFQELFIITGRGAHSINGVANIKIKTKSRLQERNLV